MPYVVQTAAWNVRPTMPAALETTCDCHQAQKFCAPSFVFSISGQVKFRHALMHLLTCSHKPCIVLRQKAIDGMQEKVRWLFQENVLLGCVTIQPYMYGEKRMIFSKNSFKPVAHHLAHCPRESCARLRRSVLLTIRRHVNPTIIAAPKTIEENDPDQM